MSDMIEELQERYRRERIAEIKNSNNLHEIALHYRDLIQFIEECEGQVYPEVEQSFNDHAASFDEKVDALRVIMVENYSRAARDQAESEYFAARAQAARKAAEWAEGWIIKGMNAAKVKVAGQSFPQRRQTNGRPSIRWNSVEPIPEPFRRVTVELDGNAAYDAWKRQRLPDGFVVERGEHLRDVITPKRKKKGKKE